MLSSRALSLVSNEPFLEETVRWSIATATATAEIFGTGFPDEEHIRRVLPRVVVERLSPKN